MSKRILAHPQIVLFNLLYPFIFLLFPGILIMLASLQVSTKILILIAMYIVFFFIGFAIWHDAYFCIRVTAVGLERKGKVFLWNDVRSYELRRVQLFNRPFFPKIILNSFICLNCIDTKEFFDFASEEQIFFALTPRHLKVLADCGRGKNPIIDQVLKSFQ